MCLLGYHKYQRIMQINELLKNKDNMYKYYTFVLLFNVIFTQHLSTKYTIILEETQNVLLGQVNET